MLDTTAVCRAKIPDGQPAGKKKIKAIARALQRANRTPRTQALRRSNPFVSGYEYQLSSPTRSVFNTQPDASAGLDAADPSRDASRPAEADTNSASMTHSTPMAVPERQPLRTPGSRFSGYQLGSYGSIIATPPTNAPAADLPSLELPDPAIDPADGPFGRGYVKDERGDAPSPSIVRRGAGPANSDLDSVRRRRSLTIQSAKSLFGMRVTSIPGYASVKKPPLLKRVFASGEWESPGKGLGEAVASELERREDEFFEFLDSELNKIESFYKMKEQEATDRLQVLRQQLHTMRDRRIQEVLLAKMASSQNGKGSGHGNGFGGVNGARWKNPITGKPRFGKNSRALTHMSTPSVGSTHLPDPATIADRRDFMRRPDHHGVPYRSAKRKLKLALQEFYRGLELLKAYAYLNRTAFRKINKKYDKTVDARPPMRYMSEKVNQAYFVRSEVIESHLLAVEDLYARYFERGRRKIAVGKLRHKSVKPGDYSASSFRVGLLVAAGLVFGIQGLVYAIELLGDPDPTIQIRTSYLLQTRINYSFVFEYDSRHVLDWRQLAEWRLLLAGFYPVEFRDFFLGDMYCSQTYSMGVSDPIPGATAGADMFQNIELFFCLYANHWDDPTKCNSSHSRLLGFLTTVPSILRGFQCIRRFHDTKNVFPHLVNLGKYMFGVLYYMTLSLYRINKATHYQAVFITFALLNSVYTSVWDLAMDWSLCNPYAKRPFLRDHLAFRKAWVYYVAMFLDVVIRCNWVFYAIFAGDIQHSALLSFFVSFSEICRRGVWTIFRVENEHCTNVTMFRALRDVPLPYDIPPPETPPVLPDLDPSHDVPLQRQTTVATTTGADVEQGTIVGTAASMRQRRQSLVGGIARVGSIMAAAHAQDFERKKRPDPLSGDSIRHEESHSPDDSSEEEEEAAPVSRGDDAVILEEELPSPNAMRDSPRQ
ncbi:EXS family-domain-containing protein [Thermoascus aurantiacus ATCC 26904]